MFASTTAITAFLSGAGDVGYELRLITYVVCVGLVALLGLGFGIHATRKYITGRKF